MNKSVDMIIWKIQLYALIIRSLNRTFEYNSILNE